MSSNQLTAGTVMRQSAALLNDVNRQVYTYAAQIPYVNMAMQELQELFELNEVPVTDAHSAVINVPAGYDHIAFNNGSNPELPDDLIEPSILWERNEGIDPYIRMTKVDVLPLEMSGVEINQFLYYVWASQEIRFFPSNMDNDIKIDYIRNLFTEVTDENTQLNIINAATFLEYKTASLCAEFIGENKTRADSLNNAAFLAMDRVLGIGSKGRQNITTRHRPFRSNYKRRVYS